MSPDHQKIDIPLSSVVDNEAVGEGKYHHPTFAINLVINL